MRKPNILAIISGKRDAQGERATTISLSKGPNRLIGTLYNDNVQ